MPQFRCPFCSSTAEPKRTSHITTPGCLLSLILIAIMGLGLWLVVFQESFGALVMAGIAAFAFLLASFLMRSTSTSCSHCRIRIG